MPWRGVVKSGVIGEVFRISKVDLLVSHSVLKSAEIGGLGQDRFAHMVFTNLLTYHMWCN